MNIRNRVVVLPTFVLAILLVALVGNAQDNEPADGKVRVTDNGVQEAWDANVQEWVSLETFWLNYAERRGGLTWGRRADYPPYNDVDELDTMIIELDSGPCMMEFFHTRWRRANDVRRWDEAFNEYGGCPHVFD